MTTLQFAGFVAVVVFAAIVLKWDYIVGRRREPSVRASDAVEEDGWPHRGE